MIDRRREEILNILNNSESPVSGSELGKKFDVSRQVIVQDIAVLRAEGEDIIATPKGYMIVKKTKRLRKKIVCQHNREEELEEELRIIIDNGGKVIDVIVEHPIYGEITANLDLENNFDIDNFIESIKDTKGKPLSALTDGLHLHTIEVDNKKDLENIKLKLFEKNYLKK